MRSARGYSVAEMLVALLLVSVVLACAGIVFTAIGRRADREAGRSPGVGGMTDAVMERLERDLQLATELPSHEGRHRAGPQSLLLRMPDESLVVWRQEGSRLLRGAEDERGRLRERPVLDALLVVNFSERTASLFDVVVRRRDEPLRRRTVLLRNVEPDDEGRGR